jgi:hypothetical protein
MKSVPVKLQDQRGGLATPRFTKLHSFVAQGNDKRACYIPGAPKIQIKSPTSFPVLKGVV